MRQLRSAHVVISLFLLLGSTNSSGNNLCQCGDTHLLGRNVDTQDSHKSVMTVPDPGNLTQSVSQGIPAVSGDDLPPGGVSSGGYQPSSRGSLSGKSTVTDSELPARASTPEGNPPSLPTPKQTSETPSAPGGSAKSQTQLKPSVRGANSVTDPGRSSSDPCISPSSPSSSNGSLADCGLSSSPSSTNNGTSSQASGDQATAHQRPGARSNGQAALPGSASNLTSNILPSGANSSSSLPNQPSTVPGVAEKSQSNSGQPTDDQKTAIIASSVILGALLILGAIMAVLRRKQSKREAMKHHEEEGEAPLRATPGELGKRGTVLIGRGLETSHGLPSSGGWLDNRASESATTPGTLSISASSTSADSNEANLNQT
ncbi:hypothetical protein H4Q26_017979 [Puccinia striiformis f. sp. tritici PST-130]|nr:hypothetical protein Pst134EB_006086 [Puccinia striiformis f. sp. tritici]KAI9628685.1 hypothetical protein H4Q26_017979 [Puccinia striiformis f. sp. tritici PST-130]